MRFSISFALLLSIVDIRKVFSLPARSLRQKVQEIDVVTREVQVTTVSISCVGQDRFYYNLGDDSVVDLS